MRDGTRKSRLNKGKKARLIEHFVAGTTARCAAALLGVNRTTGSLLLSPFARDHLLSHGARSRSGCRWRDRSGRVVFRRPALHNVELGRNAWRLTVDQVVRSFGIETQKPIADDLEPYAAAPRPIRAPAAFINLCQSQKPPALPRILRSLSQTHKSAAPKSPRQPFPHPLY